MGGKADRPVHVQQVHLGEQVLPVVPFDLGAGPPAEQNELQRSRIGNVGRHVEQVLACPPGTDRGGERIALAQEGAGDDQRQCELEEAATEDADESAEDAEKDRKSTRLNSSHSQISYAV